MKILFVNLSGESVYGGVELFLKRLSEILKSDCEIKVLSHLKDSDIILRPSEENKIYSVIKRFHDDGFLIHIHKLFSSAQLKKTLNLKNVVMTLHDSFYACADGKLLKHFKDDKKNCFLCAGAKKWMKYKYRLGIIKKARLLLTPSLFLKEYLLKASKNLNIKVLPHFFYDLKVKEEEINYGDYAYFLGRLEETKGVGLLLDSFRASSRKLVIQGKGALESKVRAAAEENKNIIYKDDMAEKEIYENYKGCLFTLMPSLQPESFGLSGFEGYNFKKPCLSFAYGGVREWLDETIGFLCPPARAELKEKIDFLFENKSLVKEKGEKGVEFLKKNFSSGDYAGKYIETLKGFLR